MEGGDESLDLAIGAFKPEDFNAFGEFPCSDDTELVLSALFICVASREGAEIFFALLLGSFVAIAGLGDPPRVWRGCPPRAPPPLAVPGDPSWFARGTPGDAAGEEVPRVVAEGVEPVELLANRGTDCEFGRAIDIEKEAVGVVGLFSPEACPLGAPSRESPPGVDLCGPLPARAATICTY